MDTHKAQDLLQQRGYEVVSISQFPFGQNREVFDFTTSDGSSMIARFVKEGKWKDMQYQGLLSLERDMNMYALAGAAGLPTPQVRGYHDAEGVPFLVVEKLPGQHWKTFLEEKGYSLDAYLHSLECLGSDLAKAHTVSLPSYGDVISRDTILPPDITNFAVRLEHILSLKLAPVQRILSEEEFARIQAYFSEGVQALKADLGSDRYHPTLILTNLHPMNFLVDKHGKPSGYPDLEFSQAGVPALEMYNMGLQLFSYFDQPTFDVAREAFFRGYAAAGGVYDTEDKTNKKLETLLCAGHTLSSVTGYHGVKDGLRDTWSDQFKDILFQVISSGEMDYVAFADVIRGKTKQPQQPKLP